MKKIELKEIIRKEVREALDSEFEKAQDKLYTSVTGKEPGSKGLNKFRTDSSNPNKKYIVSYWYTTNNGNDVDNDYITDVIATSPEEAIEVVMNNRFEYGVPRTAKNFKATEQKN